MVQIHHLHVNRFHMVKILRKSVQYTWRYLTKYASFLAVSYLTLINKPVISGITWQESTNFLDDVAPSSPLLMRTASRP